MSTCTSDIPGSQVKYFCTYCQDEISYIPCQSNTARTFMIIYVCCAICEEFNLCLMCFSSGAEIGSHKNYHDYKLVTFSNTSIYSLKILDALEEWFSEDTEKYLGTKKIILSWKDVANAVGSENFKDAKIEFENLILNQKIWELIKVYAHAEPLITYDDAVDMGCIENSNKTNRLIAGTGKKVTVNEKNIWTKRELELLLEYTAIYGYGNWGKISREFNKTIFYEHFGTVNDFIKITPEEIKKEYLLRYCDGPIRRGTWKPPSNAGPIILDRTRFFKPPVDLKYPVVDYNLFAFISYNYIADEFEYPYMDTAESTLDNLKGFETNFEHYYTKLSMKKNTGAATDTGKPENWLYDIRTLFDIKEEKALIALERYNSVLRNRKTAKKCVHNYRLIEQFSMYKDKKIPKIKPFSEQTFGERLVKMSRFMTVDIHRTLIEGVKNENLLTRRLKELKFYRMIGLTKLSEIDTFNNLKKHRCQRKISILHYTDTVQQTFNELPISSGSDGKKIMKYIQGICSKRNKSQIGKNKGQLKYLPNDNCEELLSTTEKMLCLKYNLNSNYYLKTKCDILNHGLKEDYSKIDYVIYKYLVYINKVKVQKPILKPS